jgi:glycine/D-amino acid oxidase-like deaminating enzyme
VILGGICDATEDSILQNKEIFTKDFKNTAYWWDLVEEPQADIELPVTKTDVVIIGSGYTGLCAGIQTARAGRETLILDAERLGWGCSSQNGGQVSGLLKPSLADLSRKYGAYKALRILQEGANSMQFLKDFIADEGIDCDVRMNGKFRAAHNAAQYEAMAKKYTNQIKGLELNVDMVPQSEQRREIGSDAYFGGAVIHSHFSLNPAKFHSELVERARGSGAKLVAYCRVEKIDRQPNKFLICTSKGIIEARDVIVATSGYTDKSLPWHHRRIIPIGSYMITTEVLGVDVVKSIIPNDRIVTDSRKLVYYYRSSPDRRRILFGGRVSLQETNPKVSAPLLRNELVKLFPQISDVKISHSWMGYVDFTFDSMPHIGCHDGLYYALGYCGSGIATASYLGTRVGQKLLEDPQGMTELDDISFNTRPLYTGNPWFLAPSVHYYRWLDKSGR